MLFRQQFEIMWSTEQTLVSRYLNKDLKEVFSYSRREYNQSKGPKVRLHRHVKVEKKPAEQSE